MNRTLWPAVLAVLLGACSSIEGERRSNILIPGRTLHVSPSLSIPAEAIATGIALYLVIDPLAPNWRIEEARIGDNRYRIALRKKRFAPGGDGEAPQLFQRRAEQLVRETGRTGYTVLEFSEGIDSHVPIAQRVTQGIIELR